MKLQALSVQCVMHLFQRYPWEFSAANKSSLLGQTSSPQRDREMFVRSKGKDGDWECCKKKKRQRKDVDIIAKNTCMWCTEPKRSDLFKFDPKLCSPKDKWNVRPHTVVALMNSFI